MAAEPVDSRRSRWPTLSRGKDPATFGHCRRSKVETPKSMTKSRYQTICMGIEWKSSPRFSDPDLSTRG